MILKGKKNSIFAQEHLADLREALLAAVDFVLRPVLHRLVHGLEEDLASAHQLYRQRALKQRRVLRWHIVGYRHVFKRVSKLHPLLTEPIQGLHWLDVTSSPYPVEDQHVNTPRASILKPFTIPGYRQSPLL